ncbi:MAG: hypothetical protein EBW11_06230 [Betaproteobacteria bacterium]|nr:hypothetical protein [Betaproteobacteria bacterium]
MKIRIRSLALVINPVMAGLLIASCGNSEEPTLQGKFANGPVAGLSYSTSAGIYMGVRTSEWDGKPVHFFQDGHINGIEQTCFAIPVEIAIKSNITVQ